MSRRYYADDYMVVGATAALTIGTVLGLAGVAADAPATAISGGAVAALALGMLVTANLVSGAMVVVLSVALPAVYSSADLRIAFAAPVAALASFAWLLRVCFERRDIAVGRMPVRALSFMLVAMIISSLFSDSIGSSLRETANFVVLIAFGLAVCDEFRQDDAARTHTLQLLVVVAALCGLMAVPQMVGLIPSQFPRWGTPFYRADLGFGQPNGLGLFLAMCLPLALQQVTVKQGGRKLLASLCAVCIGLGLFATFSRTAWLAAGAAILILPFFGYWRAALRLLLVGILAAVILDLTTGGMLRDTAVRTVGDWIIEQRAALFIAGVRMFQAHPLVGVGPGGFADHLQDYAASISNLWDYQPTPHNAFVQVAAESGLIGLFSFFALIVAWFRTRGRSIGSEQVALTCVLGVVTIASLGIWPFAHGTGEVLMLVIAAAATGDRA